jgi:hypothetical protein
MYEKYSVFIQILKPLVAIIYFGAFVELLKATIIFVMSVRQSVRIEQRSSHSNDFREI